MPSYRHNGLDYTIGVEATASGVTKVGAAQQSVDVAQGTCSF